MSDALNDRHSIDLEAIRERLKASRGRDYWRSLEQLADTEEFREFLYNEFPSLAPSKPGGLNRRDLLKIMGASLALAGFSACTSSPPEKIVPYVRAPEELVPGRALFYATAMPTAGHATGLLVESHLGRPTKIEGNPQHPASLGATDAFAQASILTLYDPDRSQAVLQNGRPSSWTGARVALDNERGLQAVKNGATLRILTGTVTSPALAAQIGTLLASFPDARWHQYEPAGGHSARAGAQAAFGTYVSTVYNVAAADVILSLDADFLNCGPGSLRYARDWASRRHPQAGGKGMNRLYAVESTPSNTGAVADHRLPLRPGEIENFARAVAHALGVQVDGPTASSVPAKWADALVADLKAHRASSLVIPGEYQVPEVHALAHAMNAALGNDGATVVHTDPIEANPIDQIRSLLELVEDMKAGRVETLLILGGNPVFDAPADFEFAKHLMRVKQRIHLGLYEDETARLCQWHIPEAYYLEAWGDARAFDGTASIIQPLIAPLYSGKSAHEVLAAFAGRQDVTGYDLVREYWKGKAPAGDFEEFWRASLHDGVVAGSAFPARTVALKEKTSAAAGSRVQAASGPSELAVVFRPDPTVFDGRFANNGWLQELPKPLTKLTWENAILISPETSQKLGNLQPRATVELHYRESVLRGPIWITPGQPNDTVTVFLGNGRTQAGRVGTGAGYNGYAIRMSDAPWTGRGATLRAVGGQSALACTQDHHSMDGRHLVRVGTAEEFERNPKFAQEMGEDPPRDLTLYPNYDYSKTNAWGMGINLGACTGCSACVVACQSENNIPVVGKDQVLRGREMHWLRIDRYYEGNVDNPAAHFQPLPCMHCETAPCEVVCPVAATTHSADGLNQMVYNRCVGTRYCSNNCPYKVRRFNFLQYSDWETESLKPLRNPDVTVRARGVMEKCTYCVQRINAARIEAEKQDRPIRDGEVVTACQAACPTGAIVFGDINDKSSEVAQLKSGPLNYGILTDLNTRPRTTYLAKLRNPNPEIERE